MALPQGLKLPLSHHIVFANTSNGDATLEWYELWGADAFYEDQTLKWAMMMGPVIRTAVSKAWPLRVSPASSLPFPYFPHPRPRAATVWTELQRTFTFFDEKFNFFRGPHAGLLIFLKECFNHLGNRQNSIYQASMVNICSGASSVMNLGSLRIKVKNAPNSGAGPNHCSLRLK